MNQPQRREAQRKATDSEPLLTRRQSIVLVIILVAILGFPAFQMADDWRFHTQGVLATSSHCTVVHVVSSRNDWDELHIDYVTADGVRQEHTDSLVLWLSRPDPTKPCEVRYSPTSPWRYSTNWAFDQTASRLAWLVFVALTATWLLTLGWWQRRSAKRRAQALPPA